MADFKIQAQKAEQLKLELMALPEYTDILRKTMLIKATQGVILANKDKMENLKTENTRLEADIDKHKDEILKLLLKVEEQSGYTKMPLGDLGTAYLASSGESYDVINEKGVPSEFVNMRPQVDKKRLTAAIDSGVIDKKKASNWLKVIPAHKYVVIK